MEANLLLGYGFIVLAFLCCGTFALPSKFAKGYAWENTWGAFFLGTMVIIPAIAALLLLKGTFSIWSQTWSQVGAFYVMAPIAFGFLWGFGALTFGIGVSRIGMSIGYAVIMGLCALIGSMLPLLTQHADKAFTTAGFVIIGGICVCVVGIGICGYAGILRERSQMSEPKSVKAKSNAMIVGLLICIMSGIFSSCCNLAFSYGGAVGKLSEQEFGNPPWVATLSVWLLIFAGGFLAAGSFSVLQLFKNGTWKNFLHASPGRNLSMSGLMAILHFGSCMLYGIGAYYLGELGTSIGWSVNMSGTLIAANVLGFMTAEWKGASRNSIGWIGTGLAVLILGMVILGMGNQLQQ
jgi:L-rhamnose-H+ transport protein